MLKITLYTINNCPFCQQEKAYLNEHKFLFEEKNIDVNHAYLSEMLALSDNFTGVPFTLIQKDDGSKVMLKGFTKEEFDTAFDVTVAPVQATPPASSAASAVPPASEPVTSESEVLTAPITQPEPSVGPLTDPAIAPPIPALNTTETPIQSAISSEDAHKETFMHIPSSPSASPAHPSSQQGSAPIQSGSTPDNSHDQKLQDILSNLQKISGMSDQSTPIQSGSIDTAPPSESTPTTPSIRAVSEPVVSTAPLEPSVPSKIPDQNPSTPIQSESKPFAQPQVDSTPMQSEIPPSLLTNNLSPLSTETPIPQKPSIPDFPKE